MKISVISILLLIVFLTGLTITVVPVKADTVIHVYPGQSIQEAVDQVGVNGTVIVHEGEYHQSVVIRYDGVKLIGERAILDGTPPADEGTYLGYHGIGIDANYVYIEGFEIRNYRGEEHSCGIICWPWEPPVCSYGTITNCVIHDNSWCGILIGNPGIGLHEGWKIIGNKIYDNGHGGIELTYGINSIISNNYIKGGTEGIRLGMHDIPIAISGLVISNNEITETTFFTIFFGLSDYGAFENVKIEDNIIHDNYGYDGLHIGVSKGGRIRNWLIRGNKIYRNNAAGIGFWFDRVDGTVEDINIIYNKVYDNSGSGIVFWFHNRGTLKDVNIAYNIVTGNGDVGILLWTTEDGILKKCNIYYNVVTGNAGDGVSTNGDCNEIYYNKISQNEGYGVRLGPGSERNTVYYNDLRNNRQGPYLDEGTKNKISKNIV